MMRRCHVRSGIFLFALLLVAACATPRPDSTPRAPQSRSNPGAPAVLVRITPEYPEAAGDAEGYVTLTFSLNEHGNPIDIRVADSEPGEVFDEAAIKALRYWLFRATPEATDGRRFRQTFEFSH